MVSEARHAGFVTTLADLRTPDCGPRTTGRQPTPCHNARPARAGDMLQSLGLRSPAIACRRADSGCPPSRRAPSRDYQRAMSLRDRYQPLAYGVTDQVRWVFDTHKVVYRKTVRGGTEFVLADADAGTRAPPSTMRSSPPAWHRAEAQGASAGSAVQAVHVQHGPDRHRVPGDRTQPRRARRCRPARRRRRGGVRSKDYICVQESRPSRAGRTRRTRWRRARRVRCGREFDINGAEPNCHPTASAKR